MDLPADPVATGAALCAQAGADHVLYERRDELSWAEGARIVLEARAGAVAVRVGTDVHEVPVATHALAEVGRIVGGMLGSRERVYGWVGFELAHGRDATDGQPLGVLVLPDREIRLAGSSALLRAADPSGLDALHDRLLAAADHGSAGPAAERLAVEVAHGADEYRTRVAAAVADIRDGRLDKVILSRTVPVDGEIDLPATYVAGRRGNDPARSFLLRLGEWEATGFSPEVVASVDDAGAVVTQPLAGTRALVGDAEVDGARREELHRDPKEVFEHALSVRVGASELGEVCLPGTVRVDDFMSVKERGSVQHLASELRGRLRPDASSWDALAALFPAVTTSGVPKRAACELIRAVEPERGLYGGAVLTAGADGTLDAALVLRSVFRRAGRTWLRAGAGVVAQSDPDRELEETREKLDSVARFLVPAPTARPA